MMWSGAWIWCRRKMCCEITVVTRGHEKKTTEVRNGVWGVELTCHQLLNVHRIMPFINCLYQNSEITRSLHICAKGWGKKVSAKITLGRLQWNTFWKISSSCTNMSTWLFFLKMCHSVIKYKVQIKWLSPHLLWRKALNHPGCFNVST